MRNKETGEFELIVGNGQLVSGFFIVIVLFAVGVAMGYILGQNSEKSAKTQQGDAQPCVATDGRPQPASQPVQEAAAAQPAPAPAADPAPQGGREAPAQPTTQPAKEPEPAPAPVTKPAEPEPAKPEPKKTPPAKSAAAGSDAPSGFFWQVTAKANRDSAQATVKILKERGFSAYLAPGPNNLTRVLVGPFKETAAKAKAKTELEAMGFKPIKLDRE